MFIFLCNLIVLVVIVVGLLLVCLFLMFKFFFGREKYSVFECGFDLLSSLRLPFSLHFYIISIIFLIFDVELVLLLPFIYVFKFYDFVFILLVFFFFFFILLVGFFYEWWGGFLGWLV